MNPVSLRAAIKALYGRTGPVSVGRDLLGLNNGRVPSGVEAPAVSVRSFIRAIRRDQIDLNFVLVGIEHFSPASVDGLDAAVLVARAVLAKADLAVARIHWSHITSSDADGFEVADDKDELEDLRDEWSSGGPGIDVFVPAFWKLTNNNGASPIGGACDTDDKDDSGLAVAMNDTGGPPDRAFGSSMGVVVAHEVGHYLGLPHRGDWPLSLRQDPYALMFAGPHPPPETLTIDPLERDVMHGHCKVRGGVDV